METNTVIKIGNDKLRDMISMRLNVFAFPVNKRYRKPIAENNIIRNSIREKTRKPPVVGDSDPYFSKDLFATHNGENECVVLSTDDFLNLNNKVNNSKKWENYQSI